MTGNDTGTPALAEAGRDHEGQTTMDVALRSRVELLDGADPLGSFRDRFVIDDPDLVYLDGNSLGRLPRATVQRLDRMARDEWGKELVRAWDHWLDEPARIGELIGRELIGARTAETVVGDSTTVNLYKLATAALDARPGRTTIIAATDEFPTDRYVLEGLADARGLTIRWLTADPVAGPTADGLASVLDESVGLVVLSLVNYRSAAIADLGSLTRLAHDAGALILWDLCHAVGSIPIALETAGADLAVGCTYKYLNAGPGAPAFLYVRSARQAELRTPIQGWFGQRDQFAMGPRYDPTPGIGGGSRGRRGCSPWPASRRGSDSPPRPGSRRSGRRGSP